jgi:hypothetical protein
MTHKFFDGNGKFLFEIGAPETGAADYRLPGHGTEVEYLNRLFSAKDAEIATLRAAAQQAVEALSYPHSPQSWYAKTCKEDQAITTLQSALKGTP